MAANGVRRSLKLSSASAKCLFSPSSSVTAKVKIAPASSKPSNFYGLSPKNTSAFSRLPVELGAAISLMPLHSVTASSLFTSLLSLNNNTWGYLSEGFATTL
ncbi:hypothetical protein M5689_019489 [Euphorbia peplus]|nr:hypothetical protein M5689_019489 [Euphorbia peplus]